MTKFDDITTIAREELRERWNDYRDEFTHGPHDVIHEISDGSVPVYYGDRVEALNDPQVWGREISDPGIIDPAGSLMDTIGVYLYDAIQEALWDEWQAIEDEQDDNES